MNSDWKNFLLAEHGVFTTNTGIDFLVSEPEVNKRLCPVTDLGVLTVSGKDAASFLQGQITCNVHDITECKSSLGAMCNPKGR